MSPQKRITQALRRRARLEDAAAREQLRVLRLLRRDILRAILEAQGFRAWRLQQMLAVVDVEIAQYMPQATRATAQATRLAWRYGIEIVDASLGASGVSLPSLYGVSPSLLSAVVDVTTDQTRRIWSELGASLKGHIRRVTLGVEDPFEAMVRVAKLIRDPKTFGTPMNRAEAIVRTEVNRAFSVASQDRMEQSNERMGGGLKKWWLTAEDARVRPDHADAGARYRPKGSPGPIAVSKPFIVGGEKLMFPRDPAGSAAQTIQCRCVSVPYVEDVVVPGVLPRTA